MSARESIGVPVSKHAGWLEEARRICLDHGMVRVGSRPIYSETYIFLNALGQNFLLSNRVMVVVLFLHEGQWKVWGRKGKDLGKLRAKVLGAAIQGGA